MKIVHILGMYEPLSSHWLKIKYKFYSNGINKLKKIKNWKLINLIIDFDIFNMSLKKKKVHFHSDNIHIICNDILTEIAYFFMSIYLYKDTRQKISHPHMMCL